MDETLKELKRKVDRAQTHVKNEEAKYKAAETEEAKKIRSRYLKGAKTKLENAKKAYTEAKTEKLSDASFGKKIIIGCKHFLSASALIALGTITLVAIVSGYKFVKTSDDSEPVVDKV